MKLCGGAAVSRVSFGVRTEPILFHVQKISLPNLIPHAYRTAERD